MPHAISIQILGRAYFLSRLIASLTAASAFSRSESGRRSPDCPSLATGTCKTTSKPTSAHGVTRSRRKRPRRRCRPTSLLGRSDRPLALLLSSLFFCSETLLSRFLVASQPVRDLLL